MPSATVNWQLELAVAVRRCPLRSQAGKEEEKEREEKEEEKEKQSVIKSNNPHLASKETQKFLNFKSLAPGVLKNYTVEYLSHSKLIFLNFWLSQSLF